MPTCWIADRSAAPFVRARGIWSSLLHYLHPSFCTLSERRCSLARARLLLSSLPPWRCHHAVFYPRACASVFRVSRPIFSGVCICPGFSQMRLAPKFRLASGSSAFQSPSSSSSGGSNPDCPWEMAASGVLVHHLMSELVDTYTFCSAGRPAARPPVVRVRQANKAAVEVARVTDRRLRLPPRHLLHSLPFHPTYSTPLTELFTQLCSGGSGGGVSFLPSSSSCSSFSPLLALSRSYSNQLQLCQSQAVGSASF